MTVALCIRGPAEAVSTVRGLVVREAEDASRCKASDTCPDWALAPGSMETTRELHAEPQREGAASSTMSSDRSWRLSRGSAEASSPATRGRGAAGGSRGLFAACKAAAKATQGKPEQREFQDQRRAAGGFSQPQPKKQPQPSPTERSRWRGNASGSGGGGRPRGDARPPVQPSRGSGSRIGGQQQRRQDYGAGQKRSHGPGGGSAMAGRRVSL
eukprot:gnl/TRDRNA2_/TRDRNA2_126510_c1_seq1.p1 gnl/TRDRNA2_/TRDRNA2_126510_c1~~gnl/TRDRNA2_/TRDRNA2_126510_c1_seq1.p1  ORF type:complete len:213 (+),score=30.86 gnl/TRDRNA2_/TRDRNA2_126510_c1_seq1:184-822(+)